MAAGAAVVPWEGAAWFNAAGWARRYRSSLRLMGASRQLLEWQLRTSLQQVGGVRFSPEEVT